MIKNDSIDNGTIIDTSIIAHKCCPFVENPEVIIPKDIWEDILWIKREMDNKEFAIYLVGNSILPRYYIFGYIIPTQRVSSTSVEIEDFDIEEKYKNKIIGHMHSHGNMNAFHSGTDIEHFNYPIHIVIGENNETVCTIREYVWCGHLLKSEGKIIIEDIEKNIDISMIKEKTIFIRSENNFNNDYYDFMKYKSFIRNDIY